MNVNKKLDRLKQWAGEKMGGEIKTNVSDDFKALEVEMALRHEGMERLQKSMTAYVKSLSKRNEGEDKEKMLPVAFMGSTMVSHGEDFENESEFGQCLIGMGRANERIARIQETYVINSTNNWLESLERSLAQMKEYQAARKKLESRRLAYDASLAKMQKIKKEDFRAEEELRSQKAKYEESSEDVYRRMQDIKEAEAESIADLTAFLDGELSYYDRCREVLLQVKRDWPAGQIDQNSRRPGRSRSNTAHSYAERFNAVEEEPEMPPPERRPSIRSNRALSSNYLPESPRRDNYDIAPTRPQHSRSTTFEGPSQLQRDTSPISAHRLSRVPSDSLTMRTQRAQLRPVSRIVSGNDVFDESSDTSTFYSNGTSSPDRYPDRYFDERAPSPATSLGSLPSRTISSSALNGTPVNGRKAPPPPPPPSRAKKPPPPPPPMKRSALSTTDLRSP
ncbi:MAG: hypothetical protein MMC33_006574 [Icmadophila ericetorum]|nr:hypothetical protein [Icmadophila ericetorum]